MSGLEANLPAAERFILAVDTSEVNRAEQLMTVAKEAGARFVKLGLELQTATSWSFCSQLAAEYDIDWVADAKLDDIPNTVAGAVKNITALAHPPVGITIHANSGVDAMRAAQEIASEEDVTMLAVTHLTSIDQDETKQTYGMGRERLVYRRMRDACNAGVGGFVCSPRELEPVVSKYEEFRQMFGMIPGTRSAGAEAHDQANPTTPYAAIENGADLLVIGRQITGAENPAEAAEQVIGEIDRGLKSRAIRSL